MKHLFLIAALALFVGAGCTPVAPDAADDASTSEEETTKHEGEDAMEEKADDESSEEADGEEKEDGESMENSDYNSTDTDTSAEPVVDAPTETSPEETTEEPANTEVAPEQTANGTYTISSGSSGYTVKKEFFGKPKQDITGTTSGVSGSIAVKDGIVSVKATIQNTFSTGSGSRDGEVKKLLKNAITVTANSVRLANGASLDAGKIISETIALDLTIAGTTKSIPFLVTVTPTSDGLAMRGEATFNMDTDFGIKPPSVLSVYTVNPVMTVQFNLGTTK